MLASSQNGEEHHGIHSEVISALNLPTAVRNKITKKTNEEPKIIELDLPDDAISALVKFAYTGEIENEYLEPLRNFGLNDLYEAWVDENHHNAERPRFNYVFAISGWIKPGPADNIEVLLTKNTGNLSKVIRHFKMILNHCSSVF